MTRVRRLGRDTFASLRNRNYRLYFVGQTISVSGTWMQNIAQAWLILELTNKNGTALGVVTALQFLPMLLFGVWGGVLADRFDKRRLLFGTQIAAGLLALTLGIIVTAGVAAVWNVYLLAFLLGFVNVPAVYALGTSVPYLLAAGTEAVEAHVLDLSDLLIEGLNALGVQVITPAARDRRGASVSFLHPRANQIGRALAERGIYLWEGHGRMRASLHLFNSAEDVERLLNALAVLLRQG